MPGRRYGIGQDFTDTRSPAICLQTGKYNRSNSGNNRFEKAESTSDCLPQKQVFFDEKGQFSLFPMQSKEEENSRIAPQVPQIPEPVQKQNRISPLHGTLIVVPTSLYIIGNVKHLVSPICQ